MKGRSFFDTNIILYRDAAADPVKKRMVQKTACRTLFSEDMQHGQKIWDVTIINPFVQS